MEIRHPCTYNFRRQSFVWKEVFRKIEAIDVSLTLSLYLKIKIASNSSGNALIEVLKEEVNNK